MQGLIRGITSWFIAIMTTFGLQNKATSPSPTPVAIQTPTTQQLVLATPTLVKPTTSPYLSPLPSLQPIVQNDPKIDCIGPDGKHLRVTQTECTVFNTAWSKPSIVNQLPATSVATSQQIPTPIVAPSPHTILMPDNPYIDSFCDNLGNCVHSELADVQNFSSQRSFSTIHVGQTLTFTVKLVNSKGSPTQAAFLPMSSKGGQDWSSNLTYTKTFTNDDINTSQYTVNVYVKSQSGPLYRDQSCYNGPCDDDASISYIVLP